MCWMEIRFLFSEICFLILSAEPLTRPVTQNCSTPCPLSGPGGGGGISPILPCSGVKPPAGEILAAPWCSGQVASGHPPPSPRCRPPIADRAIPSCHCAPLCHCCMPQHAASVLAAMPWPSTCRQEPTQRSLLAPA
jgi:hypothetical protein